MPQYVIEKGVPIPPAASSTRVPRRNGRTSILRQMEPGDSVFFDGLNNARISCYAALIFGPGNYTTRAEPGGVRVWRLR